VDDLFQLLNKYLNLINYKINTIPFELKLKHCNIRFYKHFSLIDNKPYIKMTVTNYSKKDGQCIVSKSADGRFNYSKEEILKSLNYYGYKVKDIKNELKRLILEVK
jgi:hypothetical protein